MQDKASNLFLVPVQSAMLLLWFAAKLAELPPWTWSLVLLHADGTQTT